MKKWSPNGLYRQIGSTPNDIWFRYPYRLEASLFMILITVALASAAWWGIHENEPVFLFFAVVIALAMAVAMTLRIWEQRLLRIDYAGRRLHYLRRTPFGDSRESLKLDQLRELRVAQSSVPADSDSERQYELLLRISDGSTIFLGRHYRHGAVNAARRTSSLLGIPLRLPPAG